MWPVEAGPVIIAPPASTPDPRAPGMPITESVAAVDSPQGHSRALPLQVRSHPSQVRASRQHAITALEEEAALIEEKKKKKSKNLRMVANGIGFPLAVSLGSPHKPVTALWHRW